MLFHAILLYACLTGLFPISAPGDSAQKEQSRVEITPRKASHKRRLSPANLRLDVNMVLVPVTVTDSWNRPITALKKENFRVLEDGVEQTITSFSREESPVSLGLLFDSSGSMKSRIDGSVQALKEFFLTTIPGDEYFLVQFADQARLLGGFTKEPKEIYRRLGFVQARGWTALLDAVALSAHEMKHAKNGRKVLLVLSDGNDNNSRFSESEIRNIVMEGDLSIYAIGLYYKPHLLQQLADETGGRVLVAQNMTELPDVVQRLSAEIRSRYVVGYKSTNPQNDGKYHKVKIELVQQPGSQPLHASWRRGYYAPGE